MDVYSFDGFSEKDVLNLASIAEKLSEHPIGKAIKEKVPPSKEPESFDSIPGQGVLAAIEGKSIAVGNRNLMDAPGGRSKPCS